jgi:DNA-binding transcriptional ArsR family regulator
MMEATLRAIAEPRRREILRLVRDEELSAGEIASHFEVTRPAVSQHLRVLRESGLLSERRQGQRRLYRARPEPIAELQEYLATFWSSSLSRLKDAAENEERSGRGGG